MISKRLHPASFSNVNTQLAQKPNEISGLDGTLDLTGGQIKFPATQSASSDPNTLDDYEEGTFTPVAIGTSTAGTGTYLTQYGRYTKIGNIVKIAIRIAWSNHTGTGSIAINGLPFSGNDVVAPFSIISVNLTYSNQIVAYLATSSSTIYPATILSSAASAMIAMDTTADLIINGIYVV